MAQPLREDFFPASLILGDIPLFFASREKMEKNPYKSIGYTIVRRLYVLILYIVHFIKPYRDPVNFVNWISVMFYGTGCTAYAR